MSGDEFARIQFDVCKKSLVSVDENAGIKLRIGIEQGGGSWELGGGRCLDSGGDVGFERTEIGCHFFDDLSRIL